MTKETTKDADFKRYGLAVGLGGVVVSLIVLGLYVIRTSLWVSSVTPQEAAEIDSGSRPTGVPDDPSQPIPNSIPSTLPSASPAPSAVDEAEQPSSAFPLEAFPQGQLRVSNQTLHPVRVALLSQSATYSEGEATEPSAFTYKEPVHWDFAPEEGSAKGLLLSLPETDLQLESGDVLIAFAQDGSRRYWGPYVIGKTDLPRWNTESQEWRLILEP